MLAAENVGIHRGTLVAATPFRKGRRCPRLVVVLHVFVDAVEEQARNGSFLLGLGNLGPFGSAQDRFRLARWSFFNLSVGLVGLAGFHFRLCRRRLATPSTSGAAGRCRGFQNRCDFSRSFGFLGNNLGWFFFRNRGAVALRFHFRGFLSGSSVLL